MGEGVARNKKVPHLIPLKSHCIVCKSNILGYQPLLLKGNATTITISITWSMMDT